MDKERIRYVLVWSGWLRLCHWLMALGILFLIASAWAMDHDFVDPQFWRDWHFMVGQLVFLALVGRMVLLFSEGTSHWRTLIPKRSQLNAILQMIRFYLSFGRSPLPNWYAHNPLWQIVYLIFFLVLLLSYLSGTLSKFSGYYLAGFSAVSIHTGLAVLIIIFTFAHIVTTFFHDLKGKGAFISAIINGHRYFHVKHDLEAKTDLSEKVDAAVIRVDKFRKKRDT